MLIQLDNIEQKIGRETHLYRQSLAVQPSAVTVLLGATQAGKTSLMRLMAGLDQPTRGRVLVDGVDVTGVPVRKRNIAMVYQQFINYPAMTVRENIASPLRLRGQTDIESQVHALAKRLHIEMFLDRYPQELSGGQQQRVALARALIKEAPLMLFDEPLVNLDYKLREELREELGSLFTGGGSTIVYATTEPAEALMLGGYTAVMDQGELLQYGPTAEVFHRPRSLRVARAFNDPPMNVMTATAQEGGGIRIQGGIDLPWDDFSSVPMPLRLGARANALGLSPSERALMLTASVELAEISGSDTFLHVQTPVGELIAQLTGVHNLRIGERIAVYLDTTQVYVFDADGLLLRVPSLLEGKQ